MLNSFKFFLCIVVFLFCKNLSAAPQCEQWLAKVASLNGRVEIQHAKQSKWLPIDESTVFCPGDKIRTLRHSRVTLEFNNQSMVALEHSSTMIFPIPLTSKASFSWLIELFDGSAFFRSRRLHQLDIHTPFVNAVHEGTEFLVVVKDDHTEISVFDGQVVAENQAGRVQIKKGFSGISKKDQLTQIQALTIKPEDAVQWALYYPPLVDYQRLASIVTIPEIQQALTQYHHGNVLQALAILDEVPRQKQGENYIAFKASLLLTVGSVDEALLLLNQAQNMESTQSTALALKAIIAISKNNTEDAAKLALKATQINPESATAKIALSYVYQAQFEIDKALTETQQATLISPENCLAWTRLAELQLATGHRNQALKSARKAQSLNPQQARTHSVLGFVYLAQTEIAKAETAFLQAVKLNSADPLARLGLGLTKIRSGLLEQGTRELETAVSLDPDNAIMRSYLGKAYYELKNEKYAATELTIAKEMDPKDPTPWFYDAILKQTDNRPIEALHDMQKAIELNNNRGVYRSKLLLDEDLAARSASLGRIYNDLGFQQLGLVEGWKSVTMDPSNYSAHRLLADNYAALPRHEIARVSALLQSQLLQPVNITPVQPRLAESDKLASSALGNASFNEYNALFLRNQFNVQGSGIVGNNDSFGEETVYSGIWNKLSYSFGQYHFQSKGFRENNAIKQNIYNAFIQYQATSDINLQFEYRYNYLKNGDLSQQFDATLFTDSLQENFKRQLYRIGANYHPDPTTNILFSGIYTKDDFTSDFEVEFDSIIPINTKSNSDTYSLELQYIKDFQWAKLIVGGSHIHSNQPQNFLITANVKQPADGFFFLNDIDVTYQINNHTDFDSDHSNAYVYSFLNYGDITGILGVSYDSLNSHVLPDIQRFNPKLGLLWNLTKSTTVRAAYFQGVKKTFAANQTIEPVQIAGFVQFFDGNSGTKYEQFGLGLDHKFNNSTYVGLEGTYRKLEVPFVFAPESTLPFPDESTPRIVRINEKSELVEYQEQNEYSFRSYFNWTPTQRISASLEYQLSIYDRRIDKNLPNPDILNDVVTHQVPISISYFDPNGLYSKFRTTFVHQQTRSDEVTNTGNEHFWSVDALVGYKFPKRFGRLEFGVRNLLDEDYQFAFADRIISERSRPSRSNFIPERTFFTQLIFDFDL